MPIYTQKFPNFNLPHFESIHSSRINQQRWLGTFYPIINYKFQAESTQNKMKLLDFIINEDMVSKVQKDEVTYMTKKIID